jgi:methylthioribose-1-phosphate isomerase
MGAHCLEPDERLQPVRWTGRSVDLIDQTLLPGRFEIESCRSVVAVANAITTMKVRGAPAIGVTAGYGYALAATLTAEAEDLDINLQAAYDTLVGTRPTAVNLRWALDRMQEIYMSVHGASLAEIQRRLAVEASRIHEESHRADRALSELGAAALSGQRRILTHCNAGPLATAGHGTAIGVIRSLFAHDAEVTVLADETRPFLQGARLTAWELVALGIPVHVITDSMAGSLMAQGLVDAVVTGADRVAANGDVANKIGTYSLAVLANAHGVPFYVAAPTSTVDLNTADGAAIPIEERSPDEVLTFRGERVVPEGAGARNPVFDVTPHRLIAGIITENGIAGAPYSVSLRRLIETGNTLSHVAT